MLAYLLEVSVCWLLFYGIYCLLLSKETFFSINRWYLLSTLIMGLFIPLFRVDLMAMFFPEPVNTVTYLSTSFSDLEYVLALEVDAAEKVNYSWWAFLKLGYLIGVAIAFIRFFHGLYQIYQLYKTGNVNQKGKYKLVLTQKPHLPFSFFNHLFWHESMELETKDAGKIITHEIAHINQWHSVDVLFLEILGIFLWFSPPIYWYKKSLRAIHEYLADAYVLRDTKKKQYGHLLIRQVQSGMQIALANHFIHSQLKKRINMMTRNKSRRKALMRYLPAIPLLLLMVLVFTDKNVQQNFNETTAKAGLAFETILEGDFNPQKAKEEMRIAFKDGSKNVYVKDTGEPLNWDAQKMKALHRECNKWIEKYPEEKAAIRSIMKDVARENGYLVRFKNDNIVYSEIEGYEKGKGVVIVSSKDDLASLEETTNNPPIFPQGEKELLMFIYKSIKYPAEARNKGIYGLVNAKFSIEKDGSIGSLNVDTELGGGIKEEVLRVLKSIKNLPEKWIPAKMNGKAISSTYELLFNYRLEGEGTERLFKKTPTNNKAQEIVIVGLYKSKLPNNTATSEQKVYKEVDEMPRFPGCEEKGLSGEELKNCSKKAMLTFIYENVKYPEVARKKNIEGTVVTKFVVDKNGQITKKEIVRSIGGGTDEEVLSIVGKMPNWIPGKMDGKNVDVEFHLPVKFKLEGKKKEVEKGEMTEEFKDKIILKDGEIYSGDDSEISKTKIDEMYLINKKQLKSKEKTTNEEIIYKVADKLPRFPGCDGEETYSDEMRTCANKKMIEFIYKNVKYPKAAQQKGIEGVAVIRFIVEKDGFISNPQIVRNPGGGTGEEALRVVNLMNEEGIKWLPGKHNGKLVNVQFNLPIKFKLADKAPTEDKKIIYHPTAPKLPIGYEGEATKLDLGDKTITLNVFPNPVRDQVSVTLEGKAKDVVLTIFDLSGKEYFRNEIQAFDGIFNKTIDLQDAAKGTLIVNIRHQGKDYQRKVIVQ